MELLPGSDKNCFFWLHALDLLLWDSAKHVFLRLSCGLCFFFWCGTIRDVQSPFTKTQCQIWQQQQQLSSYCFMQLVYISSDGETAEIWVSCHWSSVVVEKQNMFELDGENYLVYQEAALYQHRDNISCAELYFRQSCRPFSYVLAPSGITYTDRLVAAM